jgi:hypothetical protein
MNNSVFDEALMHAAYVIGNAAIRQFPYPHFYVENVFPTGFYTLLLKNIASESELSPIAEKRPVRGYKERFVLCFDDESLNEINEEKRLFWKKFRETFLASAFGNIFMQKFQASISERFGENSDCKFYDELLLVQDTSGYALGPHTDSPRKVITSLFYLPIDDLNIELGTSIYLPKDLNFSCEGGPHHSFDGFNKLVTMPYKSNSMFCFLKNNHSFHGVEQLATKGFKRSLLLYDIYKR